MEWWVLILLYLYRFPFGCYSSEANFSNPEAVKVLCFRYFNRCMAVKLKDLSVEKIESLLCDSENFTDLKKELEEMGYEFNAGRKGVVKAYSTALKYWRKYREHHLPLKSIPEREPDYLPGSTVKTSDSTLKIIGIFHGFNGRNFSEFYRNRIAEILEKDEDAIFYYEYGFERRYIPTKVRRNRFVSFKDWDVFSLSDIPKLLSLMCAVRLKYALFKSKIGSVFLDENIKNIFEAQRKIESSPIPEKYLLVARERAKRAELPPHLSLHCAYLIGGLWRKIKFERSNHMARRVAEELLNGDYSNIYALVGQGHEGDMEYILKKELGEYESPRDLEYLKFERGN